MKTLLLALFYWGIATVSLAQQIDTASHLTFKGVPIDGRLIDFVSKMKKAGFTHTGTNEGVAIIEGEFASYSKCTVGVQTLQQKDLVSKIVVLFPERDNWQSLSSNYFNLKQLLTEKYGAPSESIENFQSHEPSGDGSKMIYVRNSECKYQTIYEVQKGTIKLSIENDSRKCFVKLAYFDRLNSASVRKQALDDL